MLLHILASAALPAVPPAGAVAPAVDWIARAGSAIGIVTSIVSGAFTYKNYNRAARFRKQDHEKSLFESGVQAPIEAVLADIEKFLQEIRTIKGAEAASADPAAAKKARVAAIVDQKPKIPELVSSLGYALDRAESFGRHAPVGGWMKFEDMLEPIYSHIEVLSNAKTNAHDAGRAFEGISGTVTKTCRELRTAMMTQIDAIVGP